MFRIKTKMLVGPFRISNDGIETIAWVRDGDKVISLTRCRVESCAEIQRSWCGIPLKSKVDKKADKAEFIYRCQGDISIFFPGELDWQELRKRLSVQLESIITRGRLITPENVLLTRRFSFESEFLRYGYRKLLKEEQDGNNGTQQEDSRAG